MTKIKDIDIIIAMSDKLLFDSIKDGNLQLLKSLVAKGTNINSRNERGETLLHIAVDSNDLNIVKWLVKKEGININARVSRSLNQEGPTALHYAIEGSHLEIASFLIQKGADIEILDFEKQSPLDRAIDIVGREEAYSLFKPNQNASLYFAISKKDLKAGEALIKAGADVNQTDDNSNTLLHLAVKKRDPNLVRLCIEKGADVNYKNDLQKRPLDYAKDKNIKNYLKLEGGRKSSFSEKTKGMKSWFVKQFIIFLIAVGTIHAILSILKFLLEKITSWF